MEAAGAWDWDIAADRIVADERFATLKALDPEAAAAGLPPGVFFNAVHPEDRPRIRIAVAAILRGAEVLLQGVQAPEA